MSWLILTFYFISECNYLFYTYLVFSFLRIDCVQRFTNICIVCL